MEKSFETKTNFSAMSVVEKVEGGYYDKENIQSPCVKTIIKKLSEDLEKTFNGTIKDRRKAKVGLKKKAEMLYEIARKTYIQKIIDLGEELKKDLVLGSGLSDHPKRQLLYDIVCEKSDNIKERVYYYQELSLLLK